MSEQPQATTVPVGFFFDYICPFCYVGSHRLERLAERWSLAITWRFLEIHPDNPSSGRPLEALGYSSGQWQQMDSALQALLSEDGLPYAERRFTTNSRRALLLAQAVLLMRPEAFLPLHRALFHSYFVEQRNIGDPEILQALARAHDVDDLVETAWEAPQVVKALLKHVEAAQAAQLSGVPTLVVSGRAFAGAVSVETLEEALRRQQGQQG